MSFRARLALAFVATMTALVVATSTATYLAVRSNLQAGARNAALSLARTAAGGEHSDEASLDQIAGPGAQVWLTTAAGAVVAHSHAAGSSATSVGEVERRLAAAPAGATSARMRRRGGGYAIVLLTNTGVASNLSTLLSTLLVVGLVVVAASALLGAALAAGALRPVERMRRQVDAIPGDALGRRIGEGRADELGRLAAAFNRLLARAERATREQQQFVADASHELRTPVTALQGHVRIVARAAERGDLDQVRESAAIVATESGRLARTVAELLSLAEDAGATRQPVAVRLDLVAAEACAELAALHPSRRIVADLAEATVPGDAGRLGELARILVDNGLRYSPPGEQVDVSVDGTGGRVRLRVRDYGPGLSADDRERAFDRFYRGTASHGVEGSGLGLAIARSICERHQATLTLQDAPGGGTLAVAAFADAVSR
ncbi:MAG TPA: HAMP domain-containing sensor histidine kinase [Gaiellales bacterium]|nr:HAMP domain-containing sensor histidine kinase [Gaiellales bacterium]